MNDTYLSISPLTRILLFTFARFSLHVLFITGIFTAKPTTWWNELVATGLFAVVLGIFLIILNCLISKREEDDLEEYVQRQLTRSRSGHRLERDLETGGLTTRHNLRMKQTQKVAKELTHSKSNITPDTSEAVTPTLATPNGKPIN